MGIAIAYREDRCNFGELSFTTEPIGVYFTITRGRKSGAFGTPCFCPLPKQGVFDETAENDEFAFYPQKQGLAPRIPPTQINKNDKNR